MRKMRFFGLLALGWGLCLGGASPVQAQTAVMTVTLDPMQSGAAVTSYNLPQPSPTREYRDFTPAGPVTLPFSSTQSVTSDAVPDDADDSASLLFTMDSSGFSGSFSLDGEAVIDQVILSAAGIEPVFSSDIAVVYTISGSLTGIGEGIAQLDGILTRESDGTQLYGDSQSGPAPLTLGPGTGAKVGTLVGGETYRFDSAGGLGGFTPAPYSYSGSGSVSITFVDAVDTDGDGVADDGDVSGSGVDAPCVGGASILCDDNCPTIPNLDQADTDGDGIGDACEAAPAPVPVFGGFATTVLAGALAGIGALGLRRRSRG